MAHLIDPTVTGNYPVLLGDGLLSNTPNEIFTGIRYNHKPNLTSDARLKPSLPGKTSSYDLTFHDAKGSYAFAGTRTTENDDYVMYFDPQRKAFILDKVDSTFNMNITRVPGNSNPEELRRQYPHLEKPKPLRPDAKTKPSDKEKTKPSAPQGAGTAKSNAQSLPKSRRVEKKQQPKKIVLTLPEPMPLQAEPETKSQRNGDNDDEDKEEDDDDDDGGLVVVYPGAENAVKKTDFSPAFPVPRRFDDFMDQRESEADDADGEDDEEIDMNFKLPSPVNHNQHPQNGGLEHNGHVEPSDAMEIDEAELEAAFENAPHEEPVDSEQDDLEKEMEIAFGIQNGSPDGDESEISEED